MRLRTILILAALLTSLSLLIVSQAVSQEPADEPAGEEKDEADSFTYRHNVMIVLDTSGSMGEMLEERVNGKKIQRSKLQVAKEAAHELFAELRSDFHVGLIIFDDMVPKLESSPAPLTDAHRQLLISRIDAAKSVGHTPIAASMKMAAEELERYRLKNRHKDSEGRIIIQLGTIIALTDGLETCNGDINATARDIDSMIFWSYMIGFRLTAAQAQEYRGIGEYVDAGDAASLRNAFKTIRLELERPRSGFKERED
ncbi:MAG: VWA domain-containing protein [Planctomycetota bacterium]|nr:VWA domain-containing protein [Planctomycetota bacterium]